MLNSSTMKPSNRRTALKALAGVAAAPALEAQQHQHGVALVQLTSAVAKIFNRQEMAFLAKIADLIIPRTDTPGAADAGVHFFIDGRASHDSAFAKNVRAAAAKIDAEAKQRKGKMFADMEEADQIAMLIAIQESGEFKLFKNVTIDGYYTSKQGLSQELDWNANTFLPEFKGCTHPEHQA